MFVKRHQWSAPSPCCSPAGALCTRVARALHLTARLCTSDFSTQRKTSLLLHPLSFFPLNTETSSSVGACGVYTSSPPARGTVVHLTAWSPRPCCFFTILFFYYYKAAPREAKRRPQSTTFLSFAIQWIFTAKQTPSRRCTVSTLDKFLPCLAVWTVGFVELRGKRGLCWNYCVDCELQHYTIYRK